MVPVEESKEVVRVEASGEVAVANLLEQFLEDGGGDIEHGRVALPFLAVLQSGSPQVKETDAKFIEGARAGMVFNTVTGELFDTLVSTRNPNPPGIEVLSCGYVLKYVEWTPRDEGGGFIGEHTPNSEVVIKAKAASTKRNELYTPEGNSLVETGTYYVLYLRKDGTTGWAAIGMKSSDLKTASKWDLYRTSQTITVNGKTYPAGKIPECAFKYLLRTEPRENAQGSWYGWTVSPAGQVSNADHYEQGKMFSDLIRKGIVKAAAPAAESGTLDSAGASAPGVNADGVPF